MGERGWPPAWLDRPVPVRLPAAVYRGPLVEAAADRILLRVPPVGRFLVRRAGPVQVQRVPGATDADVGCFVAGSVGTAAALLRGTLTLRAAAVSVAGQGVLICGPPAAGKSVLAAALAARGHPVLADRVGLVVPGAPPVVLPADPPVQLWPDAVGLLGLAASAGQLVRPVLAKRAFRLGPPPRPAPLALVVALTVATGHGLRVDDPAGWSAADRLGLVVGREWHRRLVGPLGREADRFRWLVALAGAGRLARISGHRRALPPAELAARVEGLLA